MSSTNFVDQVTPIVADWLNDVNAVVYGPTSPAGTLRGDLASTTDPTKGAALVGGTARVVASIAALRLLPKTGSPQAFVTGYYAQGDGGGGAYWYDSTDTTTADNGGTIIVASDGGRWYLIEEGTIRVEQFGADPLGIADSGVAFRAACDWARSKGGGRIEALGDIYLFDTWDPASFYSTNNLALFLLPANTELAGGIRTNFVFSSTARAGIYNGGVNRSHWIGFKIGETGQYVHDITFNANGVLGQSGNDSVYCVRTMSGGCILERLQCSQAPLTNAIADSSGNTGAPVIIRGCTFYNNGPNMTGNVSNSSDYSCIYIEAPNSIIENNFIYNTGVALHNCGGIECHSIRYTVKNNFIKYCWPAMYCGVEDGVSVSVGSVIEGNYIGYNQTGIQIIDQHIGLKITNNHFEANLAPGFSGSFVDIYTPIAATTGVASALLQRDTQVIGNTFDCTLLNSGATRLSALVDSISVAIAYTQGLRISQNSFYGPVTAVSLPLTISGVTADAVIENNTCVNCNDGSSSYVTGMFVILGDSSAGWGAGPVCQDISIRNNKIFRSRTLPSATKLAGGSFTGGGSFTATYTNVSYEDNDIINILQGISGNLASSVYTTRIPVPSIASAATIAPVADITTITGSAAISTITVPPQILANGGGSIKLRPVGTFTTTTAGNIALASTAVINRIMEMTWDGGTNLWFPSY